VIYDGDRQHRDCNLYLGVITGDLFRSSTGIDRGIIYVKIMDTMLKNIMENEDFKVDSAKSFRGDSFQIVTNNPSELLRVAIYIRSYLRSYSDDNSNVKYDARLSMSIDKYNKYNNRIDSVFESAQIKSGRKLDNLDRNYSMGFDSSSNDMCKIYVPVIFLIDALMSNISKPQSEILRELTFNRQVTLAKVPEIIGKTAQSIYKTANVCGASKIMDCINYISREHKKNNI